MTDKPTPEQIQRACVAGSGHRPKDYGIPGAFTALADTIAKLDAMQAERDRNQASRQYHKAKRQEAEADRDKARAERAAANIRASELKLGFDKATADLGAIDEIAAMYGWGKPDADIGKKTVAAIAAPYQVETDPLVEALVAANARLCDSEEGYAPILRAELAKRGLEIGRSA